MDVTLDEFLLMPPELQCRVTNLNLIMPCDRWKYRRRSQWMLPEIAVRSELDETEEYYGERAEQCKR